MEEGLEGCGRDEMRRNRRQSDSRASEVGTVEITDEDGSEVA